MVCSCFRPAFVDHTESACSRFDLWQHSLYGSELRFLRLSRSFSGAVENAGSLAEFAPGFEAFVELTTEVKQVLFNTARITSVVESMPNQGWADNKGDAILAELHQVERDISFLGTISSPEREGPNSWLMEASRLTGLIFTFTVFREIPTKAASIRGLVSRLKKILAKKLNQPLRYMLIIVWVLFLGGISSWTPETKSFYIESLVSISKRDTSLLRDWHRVKQLLDEFVWCGRTGDSPAKQLWNEMNTRVETG